VLIAELVQTDDEIYSVAVSGDGNKLASAGVDRLVRVWDISGGVKGAKLEQAVENHADWVLSVNFSADGNQLITASRDKSAKIWDLKAKESVLTFPGHQEYVFGAVLSADGKNGISAGADKQLRWWDTDTKAKNPGRPIRNVAHNGPIFDLAERRVSKEQTLATASADGTVRIWNGANGAAIKTLSGFKDWVYAVALSPDGKLAAGGGQEGIVRVWDIASGKEISTINASPGYNAGGAKVQAKK
jgi:WD40 repeat protein